MISRHQTHIEKYTAAVIWLLVVETDLLITVSDSTAVQGQCTCEADLVVNTEQVEVRVSSDWLVKDIVMEQQLGVSVSSSVGRP